jgi:hypothetical protein
MTALFRVADDFEFIRRRMKEIALEPPKNEKPQTTVAPSRAGLP